MAKEPRDQISGNKEKEGGMNENHEDRMFPRYD
jgi:hypothetical protein